MRELTLNFAIAEAIDKEMQLDKNTVLLGEDILSGGGMGIYIGLAKKHPNNCFDMPICESGFSHFANGAAMAGARPIVDIMFSDFATIASDAIINGAAKFRFCTLGEVSVPVTYILADGGMGTYDGVGVGCNHSQSMISMFMNYPGLKIVAPFYPSDTLGLLRSSIRDNDPVLFFFHQGSLGLREQVTEEDYIIPLTGAAKIMREGKDITIIAVHSMIPLAEKAAEELAAKGISVELIDPRVLIPLDKKKIINSVKKTGRLIIAHEAPTRGSFAGEILREILEEDASILKAPVKVLGSQNAPLGSGFAEAYIMPHVKDFIEAAQKLCKK